MRRRTNVDRRPIRTGIAKLVPPLSRPSINRRGRDPRIFRPSQLDFGRSLSFSRSAPVTENRYWATMRQYSSSSSHGKQRTLACWSLCHNAGSHSFILRAKHLSTAIFEEMDRVLEESGTRAWPHRAQVPIWQREFWDRQLRRSESYAKKWHYVSDNPVRNGYVRRAEDWPYQGELNVRNGTTGEQCARAHGARLSISSPSHNSQMKRPTRFPW